MSSKSPLGRGLSSLIPQKPVEPEASQESQEMAKGQAPVAENVNSNTEPSGLRTLAVTKIQPNPFQPRYEFDEEEIENLSRSIQEKGILQPLVVTERENGQYVLIAGERRLRASKKAGLAEVPVVIRSGVSDQDMAELALVENIQRQDLSPIERARGYKDLADKFSMTQDEIAKKLDVSRSSVANTLRYLTLPQSVQDALDQGKITEGHAKIIAGLATPELQEKVLHNIVENSLNVRQTEKIVKKDPSALDNQVSPQVKTWMNSLSERIKNKVEVRKKGKRYIVTMNFYSEDEIADFTQRFED
mgnify:CR=1 FL=1